MSSEEPFLTTAASIGRQIVADAVWHAGRCGWVGAEMDLAEPWRAEYRALGPSLYGGTAGVGLFLAELADVTGEAPVRRTAVGAMRNAIARAGVLPPGRRDGFHAGVAGIAWAAARAAALLCDDELHAGARSPLMPAGVGSEPDVVVGSAGAIVGRLALAGALDAPALVEQAIEHGDALLARATIGPHGWSWAAPGRRHPHHLCGLAHGAAGIGWALAELFSATGDDRFREGASGAFDYERSWLDRRSGTWPDLRIPGYRRGRPRVFPSPALGTWCHGEAGIALTRLRVGAVLGREADADDAAVALDTTYRHVRQSLAHDIDDLSLCHGLAGSAEVLLSAATAPFAELAADLGRVAIERHGDPAADWPRGEAQGLTPGLFRGLAGIGWFFLRLHDPRVASPLELPSSRLTADGSRPSVGIPLENPL